MATQEKNKMNVDFSTDTEESLANAVRRYLNEIPILAITEVEIFKNDSALYDETVAHRLGLIPLETDKKLSEKDVLKFKLVSNKEGIVYSKEIKGKVSPVYAEIPITVLNKDQELEVAGEAKVGKGTEHAKFAPGILFYKNILEIKTGNKGKEVSEILASCPNKCGQGQKIDNNKTYEISICDACEQGLEQLGVEVKPLPKLWVYVESFGQLPVKDLIPSAIKQLKKDLAVVAKKI